MSNVCAPYKWLARNNTRFGMRACDPRPARRKFICSAGPSETNLGAVASGAARNPAALVDIVVGVQVRHVRRARFVREHVCATRDQTSRRASPPRQSEWLVSRFANNTHRDAAEWRANASYSHNLTPRAASAFVCVASPVGARRGICSRPS